MRQLDLHGKDGKEISRIVSEYERINQRLMPPILFQKVKEYFASGLSADVIIRAFEITASRGAHWEYTEGILKRLLAEEIYTIWAWDKQALYKKNLADLSAKNYSGWSEKKIKILALYLTYKEELTIQEEKLNAWLLNHSPMEETFDTTSEEYKRFCGEKRKEYGLPRRQIGSQ